jgi:hypothetical protein
MIITFSDRSPDLKRSHRLFRAIPVCGVVLSVLLGCSDSTGPTRDPRNTFTDWQHIQGKVCGVWTKDHNPHVITGPVTVEDGDSLVVKEGVQIVAGYSIELVARTGGGYLKFQGVNGDPIRWVLAGSALGVLYTYGGNAALDYVVMEGNQKVIEIGGGAKITNSTFAESGVVFITNETGLDITQKDSVIVRSCIFAGFRSWDPSFRGSVWSNQDFVTNDGYLDSSLTDIRNNLFYGPIGDSLPTGSPLVNVRYKGASGIRTISGMSWPDNGNVYGDPLWTSYTYIGPSPTGLSSNDYHLQTGSPAIGTGANGGNIGAY